VHRIAELLRRRRVRIVRAKIGIVWLVAVGAPEALHGAGLAIEHRNAFVQVTVGEKCFVRLRIDEYLGDASEVRRIAAAANITRLSLRVGRAAARGGLSVLRDEFAVLGELHDVRVARTIAADPDVGQVIHEDAVIRRRPVVTRPWASPVAHEIASRIEREHRRRTGAAFAGLQLERFFVVSERRRAAIDDPDDVLVVDPDANGVAQHPVVGKGLWPQRIDLEARGLDAVLRGCNRFENCLRGAERADQKDKGAAYEESARAFHAVPRPANPPPLARDWMRATARVCLPTRQPADPADPA
jgi:hypothetical protein